MLYSVILVQPCVVFMIKYRNFLYLTGVLYRICFRIVCILRFRLNILFTWNFAQN